MKTGMESWVFCLLIPPSDIYHFLSNILTNTGNEVSVNSNKRCVNQVLMYLKRVQEWQYLSSFIMDNERKGEYVEY